MFVLFDNETGMFMGKNGKQRDCVTGAQIYKRKHAAVEAAGLFNVPRSVPEGHQPSKYYRNRPQVEVRELDQDLNTIAVHVAPPSYIHVDLASMTATVVS